VELTKKTELRSLESLKI